MKKIIVILTVIALTYSCKSEQSEEQIAAEAKKAMQDSLLTFCDCIDPLLENKEWCLDKFKEGLTAEQIAECAIDSVVLDSISVEVKDSIRADYENDLSLEIKEIEEEKEDPISKECKKFLEDYATAIKDFKRLVDKIEKNPEDIGLKIAYSSESEEMNSWGSKPQMFQCSQSESFKTQVEILNIKKDKLIAN